MRIAAWPLLLLAWLAEPADAVARASPGPTTGSPVARRIVTLAPHITELLYAAGAGERLVATVEYSDYPAAARRVPRIGDAFRIDLERLLVLQPDLVLTWAGGTPAAVLERLDAMGLRHEPVVTERLDDVPRALRRIGVLAGTEPGAERVAADYERRLAQLRRSHAGRAPRSVFIEVDDRPLYTVNDRHVISEVVALCGGRNVFGTLGQIAPQVALEAVLAADPEVILSLDDAVADPLAEWRRWPQLRAVRAGAVHSLPADLLTRPTLRILDGVEIACARLAGPGTPD
jgi:iron complex transport system substrate-binding protein